jgi:hypothetical protein
LAVHDVRACSTCRRLHRLEGSEFGHVPHSGRGSDRTAPHDRRRGARRTLKEVAQA